MLAKNHKTMKGVNSALIRWRSQRNLLDRSIECKGKNFQFKTTACREEWPLPTLAVASVDASYGEEGCFSG